MQAEGRSANDREALVQSEKETETGGGRTPWRVFGLTFPQTRQSKNREEERLKDGSLLTGSI